MLSWHPSHERRPPRIDPHAALRETEQRWTDWSRLCTHSGEFREAVVRSLIVLKALTYQPTGGLVAAPTTSLPEAIGGVRNWDYRYCWLRDATFSLYALMANGYTTRPAPGGTGCFGPSPGTGAHADNVRGLRRKPTDRARATWLLGFRDRSRCEPVTQPPRSSSSMSTARSWTPCTLPPEPGWRATHGLGAPEAPDGLSRRTVERAGPGDLGGAGTSRHFTHSKVMAWVAADRAVRSVERFGLKGPLDRWKRLREEIHREVCERGYNTDRGAFTWFYGSSSLDAALLMIPLVGFLPANDPRMRSTVAAIQKDLLARGVCQTLRA